MKIQKLILEGFRGFKDKTEFELHPNVNVFVGVNGSGKTSVLDAVGMLFKMIINLDSLFTINFQKSDLSVESTEGNTEMYFISEDSEKDFNVKICVPEKGYSLEVNSENPHEYSSSNHFQSSSPKAKEKISKTIIFYYQANRTLIDNQTNKTSQSFYNNHSLSVSKGRRKK